MSETVLRGVVRGSVIQLREPVDISDGAEVEVIVRPLSQASDSPANGSPSAAGMMAEFWTAEDDEILETIYQDRKRDGGRELEE